MFGTIMRARVKSGQRQAFEELMRSQDPAGSIEGFHCAEMAYEERDPDRVVAVIHFRDRESYMANAQRPQTDANYRSMLTYLDGEPEWIDIHYTGYVGAPLSEREMATTG